MSEKTIQSIKAEGERLLEEVKKASDDSYNEVHRKTEEFKNTVDLKYGVIVTNMNDRMDKVKNEFKDYATKKYASLNKMIESYVEYYMLKRKLDEKRLMEIRGSYPLTDNINNKAGGDITSYNEVYLSIPKQSCILYANYRSGVIGYNFKTNEEVFPRFYNRDLKYLGSGITSTVDRRLYYQKIKNEGIWHGIGTVNYRQPDSHSSMLINDALKDIINMNKTGIYNGYSVYHVGGDIPNTPQYKNFLLHGHGRANFDENNFNTISFSSKLQFNADKLIYAADGNWSSSVKPYTIKELDQYLSMNNDIIYSVPVNIQGYMFPIINRLNGIYGTISEYIYIKDMQQELLPICTPYVVDKREHSSLSYDNNPNTKSIIIKCRKINPIDEVIEIYQDNNINIKALKYIKYFFDKEENNTVIINLQSKDLYVNGILIPKSYWFIVSDSIGVIIDESRTTPVLSRKIPMENIIHSNTFTGVIIDESIETTELTREGDLNAKS